MIKSNITATAAMFYLVKKKPKKYRLRVVIKDRKEWSVEILERKKGAWVKMDSVLLGAPPQKVLDFADKLLKEEKN